MANFTEKAIRMAFLELLNEKPITKITVKDIVDRCGINRNTFYYHYQDIPKLVEDIVTEDAERIITENPPMESIEACLSAAISFALANKKLVMNIFHSTNREIYETYQWRVCEHAATKYVDSLLVGHHISEEDRMLLIQLLKCEAFGLAMGWLENNMEQDIVEHFKKVVYIREGDLDRMIERIEEGKTDI